MEKFNCKYCNTNCQSISHLKAHIKTNKHLANLAAYNEKLKQQTIKTQVAATIKSETKLDKQSKFICVNCNNSFASLFSLNRHFNRCKKTDDMIKQTQSKFIEDLLYEQRNRKKQIEVDNSIYLSTTTNITPSPPPPPKGIVYFIQPAELIGTNRYKIGHSSKTTLDRCTTGYKKGSRYINIQECFEPFKLETKLKLEFKNKFTLIAGTEYFAGNEQQMKKLFNDTCDLHDSAYAIFYNNPTQNTPQSTILMSETAMVIPDSANTTKDNQNEINIPSIEIENIL